MITPDEIRNQSFESVPKGYDRDAVDTFLDRIASTVEELQSDADSARDKAGVTSQLADHLETLATRLRGEEDVPPPSLDDEDLDAPPQLLDDDLAADAPPDPIAEVDSATDTEDPDEASEAPERDGEEVARGDAAPPEDATPSGEAARLVALNLALSGEDRDAVAAHLEEEFGLADSGALLDEVYARVG